jgi:WD40 repeat protein
MSDVCQLSTGQVVTCSQYDDCTVRVWDLSSGSIVKSFEVSGKDYFASELLA